MKTAYYLYTLSNKQKKNQTKKIKTMAKVQGIIKFIDPTKDVSNTTTPFLKRTIGLDTSEEVNFKVYESGLGFEANGDKCQLFDDINVGDEVEIKFSTDGNFFKGKDQAPTEKNPGALRIYNTQKVLDVTVIKKAEIKTSGATETKTESTTAASDNVAGGENKDDLPF